MFLRKLCRAIARCCCPPRRRCHAYPPYVVVHLKREIPLQADYGSRAGQPSGKDKDWQDLWNELTSRHHGIKRLAFFGEDLRTNLQKVVRLAITQTQGGPRPYSDPDFFAYYRIIGPPRTDLRAIVKRLRAEKKIVDFAYVERPGGPTVDTTYQTLSAHHAVSPDPQKPSPPPDRRTPGGIGVEAVWGQFPGSSAGEGVYFVDVESGWMLGHNDLPAYIRPPSAPLLYGVNDPDAQDHGTGVLGILCAGEGPGNPGSGIGIAPRAAGGFVSSWFQGYAAGQQLANYPEAIAAAAIKLALGLPPTAASNPLGHVIVIQAQIEDSPDSGQMVPLETKRLNFDAIQLATAAGLTVVEAGGNGDESSWCFDSEVWGPVDPVGEGWNGNPHPLSRSLSTQQVPWWDSHAILVSAANYGGGQIVPFDWWPRGSRVDCFAWGFGAYTCSASGGYDPWFGGTSAATAIVAGAAIILQGIARQSPKGRPLWPDELRDAFRDANSNTWPSIDPATLGYMPRLEMLAPLCSQGKLHT